MEKKIKRDEIYKGKVIHVVKDEVLLDNGNTSVRELVLHNGGACIALKKDDRYFMVNDIDMSAFRAAAMKVRVGHCLFLPDIDSIYRTSVPSKKQILRGGFDLKNFFGNGISCVPVRDATLWNHLTERNILMTV